MSHARQDNKNSDTFQQHARSRGHTQQSVHKQTILKVNFPLIWVICSELDERTACLHWHWLSTQCTHASTIATNNECCLPLKNLNRDRVASTKVASLVGCRSDGWMDGQDNKLLPGRGQVYSRTRMQQISCNKRSNGGNSFDVQQLLAKPSIQECSGCQLEWAYEGVVALWLL